MGGHAAWRGWWVAAFLGFLLLGSQAVAETLRGTLRSVDARAQRIIVTDAEGDDNPLAVTQATRIVLNGRPARLADLRPGDQVVVAFREDPEGRATATSIVATRGRQ